ncbi:DDE superfamily endonuclease [Popillia japonica]|uniref:DDE superfamily endonuclease n=1 Tax=Popillia japonica TaxID=7064 RepID=A0AAW1ITH7_POPJA
MEETFYEYITNIFYPWLVQENIEFPVIIYLDNHSSHLIIALVKFCREKKTELIDLYPNSIHIMQPLDTAFIHPFKQLGVKLCPSGKVEKKITRRKEEISTGNENVIGEDEQDSAKDKAREK